MHVAARPEGFLDGLFQTIDAMDADRFVGFITEDGEFRFGSAPAVRGRAAIGQAVQAFFDTISGLSHSVTRVWRDDSCVACEGEVCYRRHDGTEVVVPFVDVFELESDLISSYRIYIDIAPLYAQ
ncbi:MAG: nuclear transport factor 2 family protein [Woeseiaceae bacterium]